MLHLNRHKGIWYGRGVARKGNTKDRPGKRQIQKKETRRQHLEKGGEYQVRKSKQAASVSLASYRRSTNKKSKGSFTTGLGVVCKVRGGIEYTFLGKTLATSPLEKRSDAT